MIRNISNSNLLGLQRFFMNVDYIKSQIRKLRVSAIEEHDHILRSIGVCAGLFRTSEYFTAQRRSQVTTWLEENAIRLKLPQLPLERQ